MWSLTPLLGKAQRRGKGRDSLSLEVLGSCPLAGWEGGQQFPNWKGLQKTGSAKPSIHRWGDQAQDGKGVGQVPHPVPPTPPELPPVPLSERPKQGRQRKLGLCPQWFPRPGLGTVCRWPRPSSALSPRWTWVQGAAATLSPAQATPASSIRSSPLSCLGELLSVFSCIPAPSAFPSSPLYQIRYMHILESLCPCKMCDLASRVYTFLHDINAAVLLSASPLFLLTVDVSVLSM